MRVESRELSSNGITVSRALYDREILKHRGMYTVAVTRLYDLCVVSSPSSVDLSELVRFMNQEYPEMCLLFRSEWDGSMQWTAKRAKYALLMLKASGADAEAIEICQLIHDMLYAEDSVAVLEASKSAVKFGRGKAETPIKTVQPRYGVGAYKVFEESKYHFDHPAVQNTVVRWKKSKLVEVNHNHILRETVLKTLGVLTEGLEQVGKGLACFVNGLTADEELEFFDDILSGHVKLDGPFGELLKERIFEDASYRVTRVGGIQGDTKFCETVGFVCDEKRCACVAERRAELRKHYKYVRPFSISDASVVFEISHGQLEERIPEFSIPSVLHGTYCVNYAEQGHLECFPRYLLLQGFSGEYLYRQTAAMMGYFSETEPVRVQMYEKYGNKVKSTTVQLYNIKDVYYSSERNEMGGYATATLRPLVGNEFAFPCLTDKEFLKRYKQRSKVGLYRHIRRYTDTLFRIPDRQTKEKYLDFVAELVFALLCFDNGITEYTIDTEKYSYITEEQYRMACLDADSVFTDMFISENS